MPQGTKTRISSISQKKAKTTQDPSNEADESVSKIPAQSPIPKQNGKAPKTQKEAAKDGQSTLDKHVFTADKTDRSGNTTDVQLDDALKGMAEQLSKLASQEYIESRFKQMVTEEFLSTKLKALENEVKSEFRKEIESVHKEVAALKDRVETAEKTVEILRSKVSDMETSVEKMCAENIMVKTDNEKMREQLTEREVKLRAQEDEINNLEQYTRRNSIRIYGVSDKKKTETFAETAQEVVKIVNDNLHLDISTADIDIAHRMGAYKDDADRPIICKLVSRFTKHGIIKSRRMLKGTPVVIKEDLTYRNAKLLEKAKELDSVKTVWSDDGKIIALLQNDKKVIINSKTDFSKLSVQN